MPIKILLVALSSLVSPALLADDKLDIDSRIDRGRQILLQLRDDTAEVVRARSPSESQRALKRIQAARDQGVATAAYELAFTYLAGRHGVAVDSIEARRNYELAVAQELPAALLDYGLMLFIGNHFRQDRDRGWALLYRAAELGNEAATAFVIDTLRDTGAEADVHLADAWFGALGLRDDEFVPGFDGAAEARAQDYAFGQASIAVLYREGVIFPPSEAGFRRWLDRIDPEYALLALDGAASDFAVSGFLRSNQFLARALQEIAITGNDPTVINNHAWLLATAISPELRDGDKAVELMEALLARIDGESFMIDTLAAAYAEAGDFTAAVEQQDRAIAMFEAEGLEIVDAVTRRETYVKGLAWRE